MTENLSQQNALVLITRHLKLLVLLGFPHSIKDHISQVVTHLFNESAFNIFNQVIYPTFWKTAKVTPLSKGDKR